MDDLPDPHAARDSTGVPPERLPPAGADRRDEPEEIRPEDEGRNRHGR